ncbi:MAG: T9SS type A sorting domain-containing protein [Bacteroidia bacterium]|nr:T9SS type A sorting domain-containing protein [Bacteroidia bacterium]
MKHKLKHHLLLLSAIVLTCFSNPGKAQTINCSLLNGTYIGTIAATSGSTFVTYPTFGPGYYFQTPVLNGGSYAVSTCGASIDTQVTVWGGFNTNMLLYNDDNGPYCIGSNASGNFVANLTNYAYMFISEYPCLQGGSSSINVYYRQNNNLLFTSSSASLCSGQSRTLTATPAPVGSVPNATFGDPGTFTGAGVSGTVFTAPTVSVSTNFTITYTFGYVSQSQVITVDPGAAPSISSSSGSVVCSGSQASLTASGASSYSWSGGISNGVAFTPTVSSNYTVTSTDGSGCKNFRTFSLTVGEAPNNQSVSVAQTSICAGGTVNANLSNTEFGTLYTLINTANNNTLSAPVAGNGASLSITSSSLASSATVGVMASINPTSGALAFDGVNDYLVATNTVNTQQGTWEAWVYKNSWSVHNDDYLFGNGIPFSSANSFYVSLHPVVGMHFRYGSTGDAGNGFTAHLLTQNLPAATWHHLAATWQTASGTTTISIFVDGYLMASSTATANISMGSNLYMGGAGTSTSIAAFGPGRMDEIKVWNVARTPSQIAADMSSYVSGPVSGLAYYWNFEDTPGNSTAVNVTGTANTATLTNMSLVSNWVSRPRTGCNITLAQTYPVTVNPNPTLSVNSAAICSGNTFTIVPSGASSYTVSGGSLVVTPGISTSYTVTGTSAFGCAATNTAVSSVTVNITPTISINSGSICSGKSFTLSPSGATTYTYSGGSNIISPSVTSTYSVTGTSAQGCVSGTAAISTVTVSSSPTIAVASGAICSGGSFTINPTGANTYTISGGSSIVSPGFTSTYSVTGTSSTGCAGVNTAVATVSVQSSLTVSIAGSNTVCSGQALNLTANGAASYTWNTGATANTIAPTPTANTTYSVIGLSSGCTNTAQISVTINSIPTVAVNSGVICSGNVFTLNPSGAISYTYSGGSATVTPGSTTSYTVIGTNAAGCTNTIPAISTVSVNTTPTITVNSGSICSGNSFTILPSGANTYTYSGGSAVVAPTGNATYTITGTSAQGCPALIPAFSNVTVNTTPTISINSGSICSGKTFTLVPGGATTYTISGGSTLVTPATTTVYNVTGTSAQGCVSNNTAVSNVTVIVSPTISVNSGSICSGNSFTIVPSGALTYTYSGGSALVSPASNTTYSVTGTNSLGCVSTNTALSTVTVNTTPTLTANSGSICPGNSFTISPLGASTYTYLNGASVVSPTTSSNYSIVGTSTQGCLSSNTVISNVVVNSSPTITVNSGSICSGAAFAIVPSGANSYSYTGGSNIVTPTVTTSYTVTGLSAQGCPAVNPAVSTVTVNATPSLAVSGGTICSGNSFTLSPSGANNYTYSGGSAVVTPSTSSSYTITGSSTQGCPASNTVISNITVNTTPTISVNSGSICAGASFTINANGANSYTYSGGSSVVNPTVSSNYTVTGISAQGCPASNTAVCSVTVNSVPTVAVNSGSICSGTSFTLNASGASTYFYSSTVAVVSPSTTSSYSVVGLSAQGCVSSNTAVSTITVNTTPTVSVNSGSICSGKSFTLIPLGASTYSISGGTATVSPLSNTSYTVTGTSAQGCVSSNTAVSNVTVNITPTVTVNSGSICSGSNFSISASGASSYTYSGGTALVTPSVTSAYTVTGASAQGCVNSNTAISTVTVNMTPTIAVANGAICVGGSFVINPTGAGTYTITGGNYTVSPSSTTNYSITGNSTAGCAASNTAVATVSVQSSLSVSISGNTFACSGQPLNLTANGAATYTWNTGATGNTIAPTPTSNATYSVIGASGTCSNTAIINVTLNTTPTVAVNSGSICSGNNFTIAPTGANTYSYINGASVVSPSATTSYSVLGLSAQGCVSSNTAVSTVSVNSTPGISVNSGSICSGNSFVIVPNGASTYTITGNTATVSPLTNTSYSVSGTSTAGCVSSIPAISSVTVNITPTVSVNSGSICSGNSFTLTPTGALSYTISGGSGTVSPLINTTYSVTGISAQGCVSSNTAVSSVTVNATPTISAASGAICVGGVYTINPQGASTYTVSGGSFTVSPTSTSSFSITGTSSLGCLGANTAVATVSIQTSLSVSISGTNIACSGQPLNLTANGASSYTWNTGATGNSISPTPSGNTTYSVIGSGGTCTGTAVISVTVAASPTVSVVSGNTAVCEGSTTTLTANGANTYIWSGGVINGTAFTPSVSGTYSVTGTNTLNGCANSATASVMVNALPQVTANISALVICSGSSVTLNGSGADTYTWTGGAIDNVPFAPLASGSYSLSGTNTLTGCSSTNVAVASVTVNSAPVLTVSASNPVICLGGTTALTASGANSYTWSSGVVNGVAFSPTATTSYSVSGSSTAICDGSAVITVTVNPLPVLTVASTSSVLCVGETASLSASGAGTYTWDNGSNTPVIVVSPSLNTTYTVSGVDANNCANTTTYVQTVSDCLGLSNFTNSTSGFEVYPNPNVGDFTISSKLDMDLTLVNSVGQVVKVLKLNSGNNHNVTVNELPNGVYFINGISHNHTIKQKVIVNK